MKAALLASGSKGNCCLVRHGKTSIIIDCGGTKRYLTQCFDRLQYDPACADALLVTHTHKDHVAQLNTFKHLPIYAWADLGVADQRVVEPFETFQIAEMQITVLPLSHDAAHTVGYVIEAGGEKLVYITDTGYIHNDVKERIVNADYYIFESNHDMEMLMHTARPMFVKQRILSDSGHLSNEDASHNITSLINTKTKNIVLAHLSQEANVPELALDVLNDTFLKKDLRSSNLRIQAAPQFGIVSIED